LSGRRIHIGAILLIRLREGISMVTLENVPSVRPYVFSMGYLECLKAYLEFLGEDVSIYDLYALSMDSFRFFFCPDDVDKGPWVYRYNPFGYEWLEGNPLRLACFFLKYEYEYHYGEPYEAAWNKVKSVLKEGRPVIALIHPREPGKPIAVLITGFDEEKSVVLFGSLEGNRIECPTEEFQHLWSKAYTLEPEREKSPPYHYGNIGLEKRGGPLIACHPYFFLRKKLEGGFPATISRSIVILQSTLLNALRKSSRGCACGFKAYEELIACLEGVEKNHSTMSNEEIDQLRLEDDQPIKLGGWSGVPLLLLQGSRQAAADYLEEMADDESEFDFQLHRSIFYEPLKERSYAQDLVPKEAVTEDDVMYRNPQYQKWWTQRRKHVKKAASLYLDIVQLLEKLKFAQPTISHLYPKLSKLNSTEPKPRRKATRSLADDRKKAAQIVREILAREKAAWTELNQTIAENWPGVYDWRWSNTQSMDVFRSSFIRFLELRDGARVLDVGFGSGFLARLIAKACKCKVIGIDVQGLSIQYARELAEKEGVNVKFQWGNAHDLEFEDNSFDVVMCTNFDAPPFLGEMIRVCREGGLIVTNARNIMGIKHYPPFLEVHTSAYMDEIDRILLKKQYANVETPPLTGFLKDLLYVPTYFLESGLTDVQMMPYFMGGLRKDIDKRSIEEKVHQLKKDLEWIQTEKNEWIKQSKASKQRIKPRNGLTPEERKKLLDFEEERARFLLENPCRLEKDAAICTRIGVFIKGRKPASSQKKLS